MFCVKSPTIPYMIPHSAFLHSYALPTETSISLDPNFHTCIRATKSRTPKTPNHNMPYEWLKPHGKCQVSVSSSDWQTSGPPPHRWKQTKFDSRTFRHGSISIPIAYPISFQALTYGINTKTLLQKTCLHINTFKLLTADCSSHHTFFAIVP